MFVFSLVFVFLNCIFVCVFLFLEFMWILSTISVSSFSFNPKFEALPGGEDLLPLSDSVVKEMSTDQKSCYKLVQALKSGNLPPEMQDMKCGPLCHARFVLFISWFKLILLVWLKVVDLCSATVLHVDKASWLGGKSTEDSPSSCEFLHHHVFQAVF